MSFSGLVYRFGRNTVDGDRSMGDFLGGKGAGLAEMTALGIPVPPGFTVTTAVCRSYLNLGSVPENLYAEVETALTWLESLAGKRFGDPDDPLLISVRSGAPISMPGMMDTVLTSGSTTSLLSASPRSRAPGGSRSIPTGDCCRCSALSCSASRKAALKTSCIHCAVQKLRRNSPRLSFTA